MAIGQHATLNMAEGNMTLRNVGKYLPVDLAKQPRRLKSPAKPLWETEFSHKLPVPSKNKIKDITATVVDSVFGLGEKILSDPQKRRAG